MKIHQILAMAILTLMALLTPAHAGFKVPNSAFGIDELEEAKARAVEKGKPLVFIVTNPDTK